MDKAALRELAEKATQINSVVFTTETKEYSIVGIDSATARLATAANPQTILSLLDENQSLTEERTAWRVTAENAEAELKAIKEAGSVAIGIEQAQDAGLFDAPFELVGWVAPRPDVVDWKSYEPEVGTPLYTLEGKS